MLIKTKIVCTMGPAVATLEKILQLIDAGMNVARLNFSHGTHAEHAQVIRHLKEARELRKCPLAIMIDTKGPEIRVGEVRGGQITVTAGQKLLLTAELAPGDAHRLPIHPALAVEGIQEGMTVLFDDGYIISKAVQRTPEGIVVEIQNPGVIKSHKGVNIPDAEIDLPTMTQKDVDDILFGCREDVDLLAASFIRSADQVLEIKKLLSEQGRQDLLVIAKIENRLGVQNFESIMQVADGIMVARGDLGVELPLQEVPRLQKMMIRKCNQASKLVVTATQMLESMIKNPRPTRAEVSDVANAIYDSTSAVMLSGETAVGEYPIEAVRMMRCIAQEAEKDFQYRDFFEHHARADYNDISSSVALGCVKTAYSTRAEAIFAFTNSGLTARRISSFRPEMPIFALTAHPKVYHQMALYWGVIPVPPASPAGVQQAFAMTSCFALKKSVVRYGGLVVITAGSPFGVSGTTNMMLVENIGDVLVRGHPGFGKRVHGKIALLLSPDGRKQRSLQDKIVVISHCNDAYRPALKQALGVVLQNHPDDIHSEKSALEIAKEFNISLIVRADAALTLLHEEEEVTLAPLKGIVYKGIIAGEEEMMSKVCSL